MQSGISDRDLQTVVDEALAASGADGSSFATQVYSGPQVSVGIGFATGRTFELGDRVQLDCGAVSGGDRSNLSRVTTVGPASSEVLTLM